MIKNITYISSKLYNILYNSKYIKPVNLPANCSFIEAEGPQEVATAVIRWTWKVPRRISNS